MWPRWRRGLKGSGRVPMTLEMQTDPSPYSVLGVAADATAEEIRRAYRAAIRAVHPDVVPDRGSEARELTAAYAILSDPQRRAAHDRASDADGEPFLRIRREVIVWNVT